MTDFAKPGQSPALPVGKPRQRRNEILRRILNSARQTKAEGPQGVTFPNIGESIQQTGENAERVRLLETMLANGLNFDQAVSMIQEGAIGVNAPMHKFLKEQREFKNPQ
jgi:hypothetical protein